MISLRKALAAFAAAALLALCMRPNGPAWPAWVLFVPLLWAVESSTPFGALLWAWLFGSCFWVMNAYWFPAVIAGYLQVPMPAAVLAFLFACAYQGALFGLWGWCTRVLAPRPGLALAGIAAASMVAIEGWYPQFYPLRLADTQTSCLSCIQLLELTGPAGLAWLILLFNSALYLLLQSRSRARWGFLAAMALLAVGNDLWGRSRMRTAEEAGSADRLRVGILQGSIPPEREREKAWFQENLRSYQRVARSLLSREAPDLLVWPMYERNLHYTVTDRRPGDFRFDGLRPDYVLRWEAPYPVPMLLGSHGRSFTEGEAPRKGRRRVCAYLVSEKKVILGVVEKGRMDPFVDTVPWIGPLLPESLYNRVPAIRRLAAGDLLLPLAAPSVGKLGVPICYDALFPASVRALVREGAEVLIQVTGDAWFRHPHARELLLRLTIPRAVETRRWLIRAVNGGISAAVSPAGRVAARLPMNQEGPLLAEVARLSGTTFYTRTGDIFYHLGGAALLAAVLLTFRKGAVKL